MKVMLARCAVRDIEELVDFIRRHDSPEAATYVLDKLEETIYSLASLPGRGSFVKELENLGNKVIREIYYKPYRIIYKADADIVKVFCVVDGRRDLVSLLEKRILSL